MKHRAAILLTFIAIFTAGSAASCKPNSANNTATPVTNIANTSPVNVANTDTANTNTTANTSVPGSLATPSDAYKTAYALRQKGDIAGLKKVMSKDVLEFMTEIGKADKKTLDDMLRDMVKDPQGPSDDVRNEKITGDKATLEYLKDKDKWSTMDFVKEGNDWKLTFPKADPSDGKKPIPPQ